MDSTPALLALDDGTCFEGISAGIEGSRTGEVVFNTAMTGYQEILTDPSYARQLVTLTASHVGNVGANSNDSESDATYAAGLIVKDIPRLHSNWRAQSSLPEYLQRNDVVAISGIDTRQLTRHLREHGARAGCLVAGNTIDQQQAIQQAKAFPGLAGMDLAREVSCDTEYEWAESVLDLDEPDRSQSRQAERHIVAFDFGVKKQILRMFVERNCRVTVVPATTSSDQVLAKKPDGIFLSNGPGDPEPCTYAISAIRELLTTGIPVFGICLGHQLLALASGARTVKMKFGHHGANHPVQALVDGRVMISSQNHGFAVDLDSLGSHLESTHISLFDGSLQGVRRTDVPAIGFQGHPEASPGPHDVAYLFDQFISMVDEVKSRASNAYPGQ